MTEVTDLRTRRPMMSAAQFLNLIDLGKTNFTDHGKAIVTDAVSLGNRIIKTEVDLGELFFKGDFSFGSTTFFEALHFNQAQFNGNVHCNSAVFGSYVVSGEATFYDQFDLGEASFNRSFELGETTFEGNFLGSNAKIRGGLKCEDAVFKKHFLCLSLKVHILELERSRTYLSFKCGNMYVVDTFDLGDAEFKDPREGYECRFDCGSLRVYGEVAIGAPDFERIFASDAPYLAWLIEVYMQHDIRYRIRHTPPHLYPEWLKEADDTPIKHWE